MEIDSSESGAQVGCRGRIVRGNRRSTTSTGWRRGWFAAACAAFMLLAGSSGALAAQSQNLLVNPSAEIADASLSGYSAVTIPGWQVSGTPTVVRYGTPGLFPTQSEGPPDGGNQLFSGGLPGDSMSQRVNLTGTVGAPFTLSAWLGGCPYGCSQVMVTVTFFDASGQPLAPVATLSPVMSGGQRQTSAFALKPYSTSGTIPVGTTSASVTVLFSGWYDRFADDVSLTVGDTSLASVPLTPPTSTVGQLDHVFVVYMEDKSVSDILGNPRAPYINSLINSYGFASDYHALAHRSAPNYVSLLGGSDFGIETNCALHCLVSAPTLLQEMDQAGKSWAFYEESMPSPCDEQVTWWQYEPMPWAYFSYIVNNTPAYCQAHVLPLTEMSTDLASTSTSPNFIWVQPDACDSMARCGIATGDQWLAQTVSQIVNSATWNDPTQHNAVFITWDESSSRGGNQVPLIVIPSPGAVAAGMRSGQFTATGYYSHYSLLGTIEGALALPPLTDNDQYATPLNEFWN